MRKFLGLASAVDFTWTTTVYFSPSGSGVFETRRSHDATDANDRDGALDFSSRPGGDAERVDRHADDELARHPPRRGAAIAAAGPAGAFQLNIETALREREMLA